MSWSVPRWLLLVALVALAAGAGWWLLRPLPHHAPKRVARVVVSPTPSPVVSPTVSATPAVTATPSATPVPAASPSPVVTMNPNGVKLALIVDDCGQWLETERGFIALGIPLTLSVLPGVPYSSEISREGSEAGKGIMLHLPMEPLSGINPGPGKITTTMSDEQIVDQVNADLAQVPLARGVNNHEGSRASADERVMRAVIGVLARRGDLFFIDSMTNPASVGEHTAQAMGVPTAARDVFLDNRADVAYSEAELLRAAAIARRRGSAIAIGHPRPTTLAAVRAMIPQLEASGIRFVLAQDLVAQ